MRFFSLLLFIISSLSFAQDFPAQWWKEVPRHEASSWEILPQDAGDSEVILSKRTELGVFSNFAATPFTLDGLSFHSLEGLWQSLKYPDPSDANDIRNSVQDWPYSREQVQQMVAFEAKAAGDQAKKIYAKHGFKLVSWQGHHFDYVDFAEGSTYHYQLIARATLAKLDQNPGLWDLLLKTKCLKLRPDHKPQDREPPAYRYYEIYMSLRALKQETSCPKN